MKGKCLWEEMHNPRRLVEPIAVGGSPSWTVRSFKATTEMSATLVKMLALRVEGGLVTSTCQERGENTIKTRFYEF